MEYNNNIDWADVENKIAIICRKFDNIESHREDLAQELRIHAYYVSDNYYDLFRKAIDFWRKIKTKQSPEIPYFDLEVLNSSYQESSYDDQFESIIDLLRRELDREDCYNAWEKKIVDVAKLLLDIIVLEIRPDKLTKPNVDFSKSNLRHYFNGRISLTWVEEITGINSKKLKKAVDLLQDMIRGLSLVGKIEIPFYYIEDFYKI